MKLAPHVALTRRLNILYVRLNRSHNSCTANKLTSLFLTDFKKEEFLNSSICFLCLLPTQLCLGWYAIFFCYFSRMMKAFMKRQWCVNMESNSLCMAINLFVFSLKYCRSLPIFINIGRYNVRFIIALLTTHDVSMISH